MSNPKAPAKDNPSPEAKKAAAAKAKAEKEVEAETKAKAKADAAAEVKAEKEAKAEKAKAKKAEKAKIEAEIKEGKTIIKSNHKNDLHLHTGVVVPAGGRVAVENFEKDYKEHNVFKTWCDAELLEVMG